MSPAAPAAAGLGGRSWTPSSSCMLYRMVGWAALSPVSRRAVYRGVAEVSVYVAGRARRRGVGRALLDALIELYVIQVGGLGGAESGVPARCLPGRGGRERVCRRPRPPPRGWAGAPGRPHR